MEEYKPNSYKIREEQKNASIEEKKKIEKVTTNKVITKKKSEVAKIKDVFITKSVEKHSWLKDKITYKFDNNYALSVGSYLFMDVLIPALKNTVEDLVTYGIRRLLRGDTGTRRSGSSIDSISYRDYNKISKRDDVRYEDSSRTRTGYNYDDVIVGSRAEAEEVLMRLDELIETYGQASVADLYDLVGITGKYTDNNYGWINIRNAEPVQVRDGYLLRLPKVGPLRLR